MTAEYRKRTTACVMISVDCGNFVPNIYFKFNMPRTTTSMKVALKVEDRPFCFEREMMFYFHPETSPYVNN